MNPSNTELMAIVDDLSPIIEAAADALWDFAEVRYEEARSSAYLKEMLEEHGFDITHDTVAGIPTAFIAEIGSGEPVIGILAEYDALPGLGNAAVPRKAATGRRSDQRPRLRPQSDRLGGCRRGAGCGTGRAGRAIAGHAAPLRHAGRGRRPGQGLHGAHRRLR